MIDVATFNAGYRTGVAITQAQYEMLLDAIRPTGNSYGEGEVNKLIDDIIELFKSADPTDELLKRIAKQS